ncbi:KAT8 regulatory NSL complex subunit 3-like isoform X2 [Dendronephthya gigantea]|uniref:KAT8 regulatory NSL complex subunit 3-like isoform X2 n=1 Tax=Dendronephthya gigantea TaxID=151771 RepID=UPI00106A3E6B|nr:KAT8 regulatory NSL complex subunit 3-like isoform X2 [Dendronephthya gigantea]
MAASSISSIDENYVLPKTNNVKPQQNLVDIINLDHNYCRPWSEREKIPHARPAKNLFWPQTENEYEEGNDTTTSEAKRKPEDKKVVKVDEVIDVETVEEEPLNGPAAVNMQYDVVKSKIVMSECEKYVNSSSSKRTPDTWEELICRTGWTTQQNVLFDKILKIVSAYRLSWLTYQGSANEPILRRVAVDKATKRVRQILSRIEWEPKLTTWLHSSMVDGLSVPLLTCYLDIVQTLRSKVPTLVDKMIAGGTSNRRVSAGATDNLTALLKRPWDATVALTSFQRPRKITGTPLLLIVPSGPTTSASGNSTKRSRFWHHHLSHFGKVIPVTMHLSNSGRGVSIGQCLDHMIGAVQAKVLELKNHFPNRPVVLIGWATGALVSFQVSLKESVCAVVCLGFPLLGVEGIRGESGDSFLENKTPTMFVFGSLSTSCSLPDIEEFRRKLMSDTSLLVIGGADDQLRLTSAKRKMERVTQSVVDRRIMDDIGEFLNHAVSSMNDDSHPRLNYFDFDDVDNRRKKPKTEYRKRSAGDAAGSATAAKKPRGRTPKAADGSAPKKPKTVKNVKKTPANKPVAATGQTGKESAAPAARPTGGLPIAPLRPTHPTIPGSIIQGVPLTSVSVPISAVSRVSIPGVRLTGVNIPVSGVNVPVSAVIKQGSLGGRSFVFPGAASISPGVATTGITTVGTAGSTHHLKIVVNPNTDGGIKVAGAPTKPGLSTPSTMQYRTALVTSPLPNKTPAPIKPPTSVSPQISTTPQAALITSSAITSALTSSLSSNSTNAPSTSGSKPIVVSRTIVTVPKAAIVSGQSQFVMHQGQLSAVSKQLTSEQPGTQVSRILTSTSKAQTTSSVPKQTVRVSHAGSSQTGTNLVKKATTPQTMARTIQVGVKRTVTYNPSSSSKTVTVASRSLPSEALTTHASNVSAMNIARLKAKLKSISGLQTGNLTGAMQLTTSQTLTNLSAQIVQSRNVEQSSKQPGDAAQITSKVLTLADPRVSSLVTSAQVTPKLNTPTIATSIVTQTTTTSKVQSMTSSTAVTVPKSKSQNDVPSPPSTETCSSSIQSSSSSLKPGTKLIPSTTEKQSTEHSVPRDSSKSSLPSDVKLTAQPLAKPTTHFIQVPASAKSITQNISKLNNPSLNTKRAQIPSRVNTQSPQLPTSTPAASISRATNVTTIALPSKKEDAITEPVARSENKESEQTNSGSMDSCPTLESKSDDEKLVEKINSIVKDVVNSKQRTTRQSVRRLVAAARLGEGQEKQEDSSDSNKEQNKK